MDNIIIRGASVNDSTRDRSREAVVLLVAMLLLLLTAGCGSSGSPPTSNPRFTSNPPTVATEGAQYTYAITATDTTSGTISFALTTKPAGAALSGNVLTWTPAQDQARISNNFVVTATNATSGKTATQSWSVSPAGTIRGTRLVTYVTEGGDVVRPEDMTQNPIAVHVPTSSGYTTVAGTGQTDGTCSIPGIAAGPYWLQYGKNYIWTSASSLDLGYTTLGRSDLVTAQPSTAINLQFDGLNPTQTGDIVELFVANTNTSVLNTISASGATTFNYMQPWPYALIDSSKGDRTYAAQLVISDFSGKTFQVLTKALGPLALTLNDGSTANNIVGTMSDVAQSNVLRANFKASSFSQYQSSVNPQATNDSTFVVLGALPGGSARGLIGYPAYLATYSNTNGPLVSDSDLGAITYGNPFPASWATVLQYVHQFAVPYTAPGAMAPIIGKPALYVATTDLPTAAAALQPLAAPAVSPQINGHSLFQTQSAVGPTPTISWHAPTSPIPTGYGVTLYRLYASGIDSNVELLAYLWTNSASVQLPPNLMSSGNTYVFRIRAFYAPGMDLKAAPYRQSFPWAYADVFSATVTP